MHALCLLLSLVVAAQAQVILPGRCPEFTPKEDFDIPPYLGKWIEIERFATKDQADQTCNFAEYSDNGDGTVGVHNAGLEANEDYTEIFGYVEPSDVPGALLLHLDGVPVVGDYNVLDTDYTTFTSVYSCINVLIGHVQQAWILARESSLSPADLSIAKAAYTQWGINVDGFISTPQESCDALP